MIQRQGNRTIITMGNDSLVLSVKRELFDDGCSIIFQEIEKGSFKDINGFDTAKPLLEIRLLNKTCIDGLVKNLQKASKMITEESYLQRMA